MKDRIGRTIDYLRVSVTDRCDLRCVYCMPEEGIPPKCHEEILRFADIERICRQAALLGIRKIKITGGEPLVRRRVELLIRSLKAIPEIEQITMTTNGVLLADKLPALIDAGLDAVTVSLDTLDRERFRMLTRRDELENVKKSIQAVIEDGRLPLKINCVPMEDQDPEDLAAVAAYAKDHPVHVRFIEMMPIGLGKDCGFLSEEQLISRLEPFTGKLVPVDEQLGNGPAHYYRAEGYAGRIGFISAVSHKFCSGCNRVRLTADGFLKSCLQFETGEDLRPVLAAGSDEDLAEAIKKAILKKPEGHHFDNVDAAGAEHRIMSQIGG
ncbi:MAG: GTP 3',8-cyclase MoaA [Lachnospiraceae bacterium]|nr:GTP 3',8-cyclase MoaA [Lachnospiraceae bacterium]